MTKWRLTETVDQWACPGGRSPLQVHLSSGRGHSNEVLHYQDIDRSMTRGLLIVGGPRNRQLCLWRLAE